MQSKPLVSIEMADELNLRNDKTMQGQLEPGEKVLLSCNVNKHNKHDVVQQRALMITNRYIYNLALNDLIAQVLSFIRPTAVIKRKISIISISGITVSSYYMSDQFVLHVSKEYDYRFSGVLKKRELILKIICKEYREATGQKMPFYFKNGADLSNYQTNDDDFKAGKSKMPKENPVMLSDEDLHQGLDALMKFFIEGKTKDEFSLNNAQSTNNPFQKRNSTNSGDIDQQKPNFEKQIDGPNTTNPIHYGAPSQQSSYSQQDGFSVGVQISPTLNTFDKDKNTNTDASKSQNSGFAYKATIQEPENKGQIKLEFLSKFDSKPESQKEEFIEQPQPQNFNLNFGQSQPQLQTQYQPQPQYQQSQPQVLPYQSQSQQIQPQPQQIQPQTTGVYYQHPKNYPLPAFVGTNSFNPTVYNSQGIKLNNVNQTTSVVVVKRF